MSSRLRLSSLPSLRPHAPTQAPASGRGGGTDVTGVHASNYFLSGIAAISTSILSVVPESD